MKKFVWLALSFMVAISLTTTTFAMPIFPGITTSEDIESERLPKSIKSNRVYVTATQRGDFFAASDLNIYDLGNGDVGASAHAYMSGPVDEVYVTIYLDRWDDVAERWRQVTYYDAEFYAADYPDGLTQAFVNITFKNQTRGYYYRLRGVFAAVKDGQFEGFSPVTAGILIEQ